MTYGAATESKIVEVVRTLEKHGDNSIIVLSGVAGTGKTHISLAAAQRFCGHPIFVRQVQFHQSFSYEDFMEGLRPTEEAGFEIKDGVFVEWNNAAHRDPENRYVLLIEEFTRANINAVLGELMTYIEHRDRAFETPLSRRSISVASKLALLVTMNPRDRSALEVDDALIRRLRIIDCPPDTGQLSEMLKGSLEGKGAGGGEQDLIARLVKLFDECKKKHAATYRDEMPFGHGIFAGVKTEEDLHWLWHQRIKHLLRRPLVLEHPFTKTVEEFYIWKKEPKELASPPTPGIIAAQTPDAHSIEAADDNAGGPDA